MYYNQEFTEKMKNVFHPKFVEIPIKGAKDDLEKLNQLAQFVYSDTNYFYNYQPGLLKNYLQLINDLIESKEVSLKIRKALLL